MTPIKAFVYRVLTKARPYVWQSLARPAGGTYALPQTPSRKGGGYLYFFQIDKWNVLPDSCMQCITLNDFRTKIKLQLEPETLNRM